jgi:cytoskeletal protein CcmA (bactofilin family)
MFVIGPGVRIWGMINSGEPVEIHGFVDGSIQAPTVQTTARSMIIGDIVATGATISGHVKGNIFADKLTLEASAEVEGEIYHTELVLREGAHFEGKSRTHPKPKSLAQTLALNDLSIPS